MRWVFLLFVCGLVPGCYASHRLSDASEGVVCGDDVCALGTACVYCPDDTPGGGGPRCRTMRDGAPDFWTWAYECDPSFAPSRDVDAYLCDGPEDCEAGTRCWGIYPGARCDVPCADCGPTSQLCHSDEDCSRGHSCMPSSEYRECQ